MLTIKNTSLNKVLTSNICDTILMTLDIAGVLFFALTIVNCLLKELHQCFH